MKAYSTRAIVSIASILLLSACSPTRFLGPDEALVRKVKLNGVEKKYEEQVYAYVQKDIRPNSRFYLALYNLVNTKNGRYRTDRIKNVGEAPHILDSTLVEISRTQIQKYLQSKGFFNATVTDSIHVKNKKASITFDAVRGPLFRVGDIRYSVADSAVRRLYDENRPKFTHLATGKRFDADSLKYEQEQVYQLLKHRGYYEYLRQYFTVAVDSTGGDSRADLTITISNPPDRTAHKVYSIGNTMFTVRRISGRIGRRLDSTVLDSQYHFRDYSHRFKPGAFPRYIFYQKGDLYNIGNENLTYDRLYDLNVFKNIRIDYTKNPDSVSLTPHIQAVPLKKMSNRVEGEYVFNTGRNGFNIGNTFTNRNVFGGAEQLEVKLRYGILYDSRVNKGSLFKGVFNRDIQLGANLIFPKLLVPFRVPGVERHGIAHTTLSSSLQVFDQTSAFSNRTFINSITYDWQETRNKIHSLTPLNIEYRNGRFDPAFRDALIAKGNALYVKTNDRSYFNLGSQYAFTLNSPKLLTYNNFFYFRGLLDLSGNTLGIIGRVFNFEKDETGRKVFGLNFLQYSKADLDFRFYRSLQNERQLILRVNPGIIFTYGNTNILPFEKNFYAGGSTGNRAWQARTLGPGDYNRATIPDTTLRKNLRNLDQLGEVKFEGNLEYRFKLMNNFLGAKLRGATFTDFGNVWHTPKQGNIAPGQIKFNNFMKQMAVGAGAGLRFDVEYFVFRFDIGLKVRDPQFLNPEVGNNDPWVIKRLFSGRREFQSDYSSTHYPDQYHFLQYNFGIGMPF